MYCSIFWTLKFLKSLKVPMAVHCNDCFIWRDKIIRKYLKDHIKSCAIIYMVNLQWLGVFKSIFELLIFMRKITNNHCVLYITLFQNNSCLILYIINWTIIQNKWGILFESYIIADKSVVQWEGRAESAVTFFLLGTFIPTKKIPTSTGASFHWLVRKWD